MWYRSRKYSVNEGFFSDIQTPGQAYVLGYLYADGCLKPPFAISFSSIDAGLLESVRLLMESTHPISTTIKHAGERSYSINTLNIGSKKLVGDLIQLGCLPRKSKASFGLPDMAPSLLRHFLRGYFDGDGCARVDSRGNLVVDFVGNEQFLIAIRDVLERDTGVARVKVRHHADVFRLEYHGNMNVKRIREYLYDKAEQYLERKRAIMFSRNPKYRPRSGDISSSCGPRSEHTHRCVRS